VFGKLQKVIFGKKIMFTSQVSEKMMVKWWDIKWKLVLFLILIPIILLPIIGIVFFPNTPLTVFVLNGLVSSIIIASTFRMIKAVKILPIKIIILLLGSIILLVFLFIALRILFVQIY
jgi:hypothetical protein